MKLRLRGNSVRLRMSRTEVAELAEKGVVKDAVDFRPVPLSYLIHTHEDCESIEVSFSEGCLRIAVPTEQAREWAAHAFVGMEGVSQGISILVEKDFPCIHGMPSDNIDTFARPD